MGMLSRPEYRVLTVLKDGRLSKEKLYKISKSKVHPDNFLRQLLGNGYIEIKNNECAITPSGIDSLELHKKGIRKPIF